MLHYFLLIFEMILTGGAFGGNRGVKPVPPEKGVFPLDHLHECDLVVQIYSFINSFFFNILI